MTWEGPITFNLFRRLAVVRAEPLCGLGSSPPVDFEGPLFARSHGRWGYAAIAARHFFYLLILWLLPLFIYETIINPNTIQKA